MNEIIERRPGEVVQMDTRGEANETVDRAKRYAQIIAVLKKAVEPMTAKEIAVYLHAGGVIPTSERNFTAPRLTELSKRGIVEPVGKKQCLWTGKMVAAYALREVSKDA